MIIFEQETIKRQLKGLWHGDRSGEHYRQEMKKITYEHIHKPIYSRLMIGLLSARIAYRLLDSVQAYRSWPFYGELLLYAAGMTLGFYWLNTIHKKNNTATGLRSE